MPVLIVTEVYKKESCFNDIITTTGLAGGLL